MTLRCLRHRKKEPHLMVKPLYNNAGGEIGQPSGLEMKSETAAGFEARRRSVSPYCFSAVDFQLMWNFTSSRPNAR